MTQRRVIAACLLGIVSISFLTGCWDNREPRRRAYVLGIGIDQNEENPAELTVSLQIPIARGGGKNKQEQGQDYFLIQGTGRTVLEGIERAQNQASRELFFGQVRTLTLSSRLSAAQVQDVVNSVTRNPDIEETIYVLVTPGRADALVGVETPQERLPALYFNTLFEAVRQHTAPLQVQIWEMWRILHTPGWEPTLPVAEARGDQITLAGIAVFHGGELRGFLTREEAEGYRYFMGKTQAGVVAVQTRLGHALVRSTRANRSMEIRFRRGRPVFAIELQIPSELAEPPSDQPLTEQGLRDLEEAVARAVQDYIKSMLHKVQAEYRTDIFGFGKELLYRHPAYFKAVEWDEVFPDIRIEVDVKVTIRRTGLLN